MKDTTVLDLPPSHLSISAGSKVSLLLNLIFSNVIKIPLMACRVNPQLLGGASVTRLAILPFSTLAYTGECQDCGSNGPLLHPISVPHHYGDAECRDCT